MASYETCVINNIPTYQLGDKDLASIVFKSHALSSEAIAILINENCPIIAFWPKFTFSSFVDPRGISKDPTCIDISSNSKFVITGHKNGSLILWNTEKLTIEQTISREGPSITNVNFAHDNNSFIFSTADNKIYIYDLSSSFLSIGFPKERLVYHSKDESITKVYLPYSTSKFCLFSTETVVNILEIPSSEKDPLFTPNDIASTPIGSKINFSIFLNNPDLNLVIDHNETLNIYRIINGEVHFVFEHDFSKKIRNAFQLNSGITAAIEKGNDEKSIALVNYFQKKINNCGTQEMTDAILDCSLIFSIHEKIYIMNISWLKEITFISWQDFILKMAEFEDWENLFETAASIYEGTNDRVFGIPESPSKRIKQIQDIMLPILEDSLRKCQDSSLLQQILIIASKLRFYDFINVTSLEFCEQKTLSNSFPMLSDFFDAVFSPETYSHLKSIIIIYIYQQYFYESYLNGTIKDAEMLSVKAYALADIYNKIVANLDMMIIDYNNLTQHLK